MSGYGVFSWRRVSHPVGIVRPSTRLPGLASCGGEPLRSPEGRRPPSKSGIIRYEGHPCPTAQPLHHATAWPAFTSRAELRNSDLEDRLTLASGLYREAVGGHAFSLSLLATQSDMLTGFDTSQVDLGFGWAYRPAASRWVLLDRLELIYEDQQSIGIGAESWRLVDSLNANFKPNERTQLGLLP